MKLVPFLRFSHSFLTTQLTQATNFTDQITEVNLKLLHINSIFSDCLHNYSFFARFPCGTVYLAIGFGVWFSAITIMF